MQYIIGIDGGGTSTVAVIASVDGTVVAKSTSGPSNPNTTSENQLKEMSYQLFKKLQEQVSETVWHQIVHIFAGISGAEHEKMKEIIYQVLRPLYDVRIPITIDNDAITALYAGTGGKPGIVQIAGTGSITFGVNEKQIRGRAGGWGHLIAENSSGYFIGSAGLEAAFAAMDGLGDETLLVEKFIRHFQVETLPQIVHAIYHHSNVKEQIASLATLVFDAANEGDRIAIAILQQTGENIGHSIVVLSKRLFSNKERQQGILVILAGSIFKQKDWLETGISAYIDDTDFPIQLLPLKIEPVAGAVLAGMLQEKIMIQDTFIEQFQKTYVQKEG